jgi:hypothetical protein
VLFVPSLERAEEAFHCRVVPDFTGTAHATGNALFLEQFLEMLTGVLPIKHVLGNSATCTTILGQASSSRTSTQRLLAHQTFDAMQAAGQSLLKDVMPDPSCSIGAITAYEALPYLSGELLVFPTTLAWRTRQPSIETAPRDTERLAHQIDRPDSSVFRNKAELQIDSFAK